MRGVYYTMRRAKNESARGCETLQNNYEQKLRRVWYGMRDRCNNPNSQAARWYHDKGIRLCDEWERNFVAFKDWALENGYADGLTIDRIDSNKGYAPDNCRWLTRAENTRFARKGKGKPKPPKYSVYRIYKSDISMRGSLSHEDFAKKYGSLVTHCESYHKAKETQNELYETTGYATFVWVIKNSN